jgi:sugar O-acyltransferase (sialic acid O-acetyltransferase NeuD family)
MKNIIIIGTGAVAAELTSYIESNSSYLADEFILKGYIDYSENIEKYWLYYNLKMPVLGDIDTYSIIEDDCFVMGISDISYRNKLINILKSRGGKFINLIHPTAIVADTVTIGEGNIINPYCIIGPKVRIGNFNLFTSQSVVSHDSVIGNNNFFATSLLCGHVKVENNNYFGIRSTVIPEINIGNCNIIQAGMIVDKNIKDNTTVFYRYKEQVLAIPKGE